MEKSDGVKFWIIVVGFVFFWVTIGHFISVDLGFVWNVWTIPIVLLCPFILAFITSL